MIIQNFPKELKQYNNFVVWKYEDRKGKKTKVPYSPTNHTRASSTNPDDWASIDDALTAMTTNWYDGIGFVFTKEAGITGIDLDHCIVDEELTDFAVKTIKLFSSYTEFSPSGNGVHILVKGALPGPGIHKSDIEMYDTGRFFTMTGDTLSRFTEIVDGQPQLTALYGTYHKPPESGVVFLSQPASEVVANGDSGLSLPEMLISAYCENAYCKGLWTKEVRHSTQSEYDLSIASTALQAGFTNVQAATLIYEHRLLHDCDPAKAKRPSYMNTTLERAKTDKKYTEVARKVIEQGNANPFFDMSTVVANPRRMNWVIKNYLPNSGIIWIAGEWSTKKTFLALSMAAHIACGRNWCGNRTKRGKVLYITGEGFLGMGKRMKALELKMGLILEKNMFLMTDAPLMINDQATFHRILHAVKEHMPDLSAIFIDTKAANMQGNDSDGGVMNDWVNAVRRMELDLKCIVVVMDHVGHGEKGRPRGSSVQMGAADAVYMVECDKEKAPLKICFKPIKDPKDFKQPPALYFEAEEVVLTQDYADEDGDPSTSLVLVHTQEVWDMPKPETNHRDLAITILRDLYVQHRDNLLKDNRDPELALVEGRHWFEVCLFKGITKNNFKQIKKRLLDQGVITYNEGGKHVLFADDYI